MNITRWLFAFLAALTVSAGTLRAQADTAAPATPAPAGGAIEIADAKLGTGVENRALVGEAASFPKDSKVYLWLKVVGAQDKSVTVIWKSGSFSHSATLAIGGSPWRTWATKTVGNAGDWSVSVTDEAGTVLKELSFKVE